MEVAGQMYRIVVVGDQVKVTGEVLSEPVDPDVLLELVFAVDEAQDRLRGGPPELRDDSPDGAGCDL